MGKKNRGTVTSDVEARLDDLFGNSGEFPASGEDSDGAEGSPLRGLKAMVMSIDWEIDDDTMSSFIVEIARLGDKYQDDKILLSFLRLLGSAGKYIKANKANSHPDAIRLLHSVYNSLEEVLLSKGMTEEEKEQTLLAQLKDFKKLKERIALRKADTRREKEVRPRDQIRPATEEQGKDSGLYPEHEPREESREGSPRSETSCMPFHEVFSYALEEIKQVIKAEFRALKAELKLWREVR